MFGKAKAVTVVPTSTLLGSKSLDELWGEARKYGRIMLHTHDDNTVSCTIKFDCIPGTAVEAKSGYNHRQPHDALHEATENAKKIVAQFKEIG